MASFPGKGDLRSPPYQRIYTSPAAAVNLTTEVEQAKNACSGMIVQATGAASLVWKDCAGTTCTLALDDNVIVDLPVAAIELGISTNVIVVVYWHPSTAR